MASEATQDTVGRDTRVDPKPPIALREADFAGIRVWPATKPMHDSTGDQEHGTKGFHVHAYSKTEFYTKDGEQHRVKVIDETFEHVTIDGRRIAGKFPSVRDNGIEGALRAANVRHMQKCIDDGICQDGCPWREAVKLRARKDGAYEERNRVVARMAKLAQQMGYRVGLKTTNIPNWDPEWHTCV